MEAFHRVLNSTEYYETRPFPAGGYNWTLRVYPGGNKKDGGSGYLSLYVTIDKSSLDAAAHQEVYADLKFYVFNRNQRNYFTIQDTEVFRFNAFKTMWGFSQVLPLDTFKDSRNGYLYDGDHCEFTWAIRGFSTLTKYTYSDIFSFAGRKWQLAINPSGSGSASGKAVSLFFYLTANQRTGDYEAVYVLAKFQVLNQRKLSNIQMELENWYGITSFGWGFNEFISFDDLRDSSKGFLVDDTLMVQVELEAISTTKYFPS
ncbi:TRAF-like family protein [Raphanus sativus]|nr:TRAF-like family protein [Raphanus sativus]